MGTSTFQAEWAGGGLRNGALVEGLGWGKGTEAERAWRIQRSERFPVA